MDPARMFAAAKNAGGFNFIQFIRQPIVIIRIISLLMAIIVFGCISSGGRTSKHVCIFHGESGACSFPVGVGVLAFLSAIAFLVLDAKFESISNVKKRRQIVISDLALSGLWTFLWFVSFCLLTNKWTSTAEKWLHRHKVETWQENNARAAIVFSLVSALLWAGITFIALQRFRLGQAGLGGTEGPDASGIPAAGVGGDMQASGYTGMPTDPTGGQQPFAGAPQQAGAGGQYYTPTY